MHELRSKMQTTSSVPEGGRCRFHSLRLLYTEQFRMRDSERGISQTLANAPKSLNACLQIPACPPLLPSHSFMQPNNPHKCTNCPSHQFWHRRKGFFPSNVTLNQSRTSRTSRTIKTMCRRINRSIPSVRKVRI